MCYMDRVGVRELRQNLSVYLRRVKQGESLEVTERGTVVAELVPKPEPIDPLERMISEGRARPAQRSWDELPPPLKTDDPLAGTKALEADREGKW